MDRKIFSVLLLSLIARIYYFLHQHPIWWDAAVYLSMGKFIFTSGGLGLWEPIRPLVWPFMLGYGFFLGIDPVIWGYILTTFFSLGIIYLTYRIAKKQWNKEVALYASLLISFTWIFFFFNVRLYTEIPSLFFALLSYYCFTKDKPFETGLFAGIAFLTKFPQGILLIAFALLLIGKWRKQTQLIFGFIFVTIPYFAFNTALYGSPFNILLQAKETISHAGFWIFQQPWYYYLNYLSTEHILFLFAIPGMIYSIKKKKYDALFLFTLFFIYFSQISHKEPRFSILFLPYLAILTAIGYQKIANKRIFFLALLFLFFFVNYELDQPVYNDYFTYFKNIDDDILVSHPLSAYYADNSVEKIYYPWFDGELAENWINKIKEYPPDYISLDTCQGGFLCNPEDSYCKHKQNELRDYIESTYRTVYEDKRGNCEYLIFN